MAGYLSRLMSNNLVRRDGPGGKALWSNTILIDNHCVRTPTVSKHKTKAITDEFAVNSGQDLGSTIRIVESGKLTIGLF